VVQRCCNRPGTLGVQNDNIDITLKKGRKIDQERKDFFGVFSMNTLYIKILLLI